MRRRALRLSFDDNEGQECRLCVCVCVCVCVCGGRTTTASNAASEASASTTADEGASHEARPVCPKQVHTRELAKQGKSASLHLLALSLFASNAAGREHPRSLAKSREITTKGGVGEAGDCG